MPCLCRLAELEHSGSEHRVHQDEPMVVPVLVEELEVQKRRGRDRQGPHYQGGPRARDPRR